MPCPHYDIRIVQRSENESAVAAAAYQSGEKLFSEYDQEQKYYSHKSEIVHKEIMLPPMPRQSTQTVIPYGTLPKPLKNNGTPNLPAGSSLPFQENFPRNSILTFCGTTAGSFLFPKVCVPILPFTTRETGTHTLISCLPCGRWTIRGSGSPRAGKCMTLTRTAKESGSRLDAGKATRRTPWIGTIRNMPRSGGRVGRILSTVIWKLLDVLSALICAPMPDRVLTKFPLFTWVGRRRLQGEKRNQDQHRKLESGYQRN